MFSRCSSVVRHATASSGRSLLIRAGNARTLVTQNGNGKKTVRPFFNTIASSVTVKDVLALKGTEQFFCSVTPNTAVKRAVRLMCQQNVGSVVVCEDRRVVGILTERDHVRKVAVSPDMRNNEVSEIMTKNVVTVTRDTPFVECVTTMLQSNFRHLPVVDHEGKFDNILSVKDIAKQVHTLLMRRTGGSKVQSAVNGAAQILVSDILQFKPHDIEVVDSRHDTKVLDALTRMSELNLGAVIVTEGNNMTGIFTERDYMRKVVTTGRSADETRISEVMSTWPVCVAPTFTVSNCLEILTSRGFRHLPVVDFIGDAEDEDSRCVDMLSIRDVLSSVCFDSIALK